MCVESLSVSIIPDCEALKKLGGINPNFFVGAVQDLDGVTYDPTDGFITGLTFATGKQLIEVKSKQKKHSYTEPIQDEGEGNMAVYQQTYLPKIYHSTQAERNAIQDIVSLDRAFVIYQGRDSKFYIVGLTSEAYPFSDWGAKVTAGDDPSGILINDENAQALTIMGDMPNKAIIFGEGSTPADNLNTIQGYLTPAP